MSLTKAQQRTAIDVTLQDLKEKMFAAAYVAMTVRDWKDLRFSEKDIQTLKNAANALERLSDLLEPISENETQR